MGSTTRGEHMSSPHAFQADLDALASLKQKWQARTSAVHCELCSRALAEEHSHLIEIATLRIVCSCQACALLFDGTSGLRYSRIPRDCTLIEPFAMNDMAWNSLGVPINLAFFVFSSAAGKTVAMYPSPAGPTQADLSQDVWEEIVRGCSTLKQLRPDVEALLVNRLGTASECYIAPIDRCYELTGLIRKHWQGFSGGEALWRELEGFFNRLRNQSQRAGH